MPMTYANPRDRAFETKITRSMVRLRDPATGLFLHMSGEKPTESRTYSWLGHRYQAEKLMQRAKARGVEWPYQLVPRDNPHVYEPKDS